MLLTVAVFAQDAAPEENNVPSEASNSGCVGSGCGGSSGGCSGSGCGGSSGCGGTTHRRCITKECIRNSVKYVYHTTYKMEDKTTYNEEMEEHTRDVKKFKEETKLFTKIVPKFRTEWRPQAGTRNTEVLEHVRSEPIEVAFNPVKTCKKSANCCRSNCSCQGQADCGCCIPNCGGGCTEVPSEWSTTVKEVPEDYEISVPVQVPWNDMIKVNETRMVEYMEPEKYWIPKYKKVTKKVTVPVYHKTKKITPTPYKCQSCFDECV